jgi:nucleoside-diphosphate-sugar epimerase
MKRPDAGRVRIIEGNLLSDRDCRTLAEGVSAIYHLAAGRGEKSYSDAFLNSVVTTRNLLRAASIYGSVKRFVNVSSFSVYATQTLGREAVLDERCEVDGAPQLRGDPYAYAKVKQDELVLDLARQTRIPTVIVRPGVVYGPGKKGIHGRIGIDPFGFFLHLGGGNTIPLTYVENCAEAIALAGLKPGVDGEVFNIVDDELPTARQFLRFYKRNVRSFRSVYVPYFVFHAFCHLWESYSRWSQGQLPPAFNRRKCAAFWKRQAYSNAKLKDVLGWTPRVSTQDGMARYARYQRDAEGLQGGSAR